MEYKKYTLEEIDLIYQTHELYRFGSENSLDNDSIIILNDLISTQHCRELEYYFKHNLGINLLCVTLKNGYITATSKSTLDEVNNMLFYTLPLHNNFNLIKSVVSRDIKLKLKNSIIEFLIWSCKSNHRTIAKQALKSKNLNYQIEIFNEINFYNFNREFMSIDFLKNISFLFAQAWLLILGIEVFTKNEIVYYMPTLTEFINRIKTNDYYALNLLKTNIYNYAKENLSR